jgi:plastocyanin
MLGTNQGGPVKRAILISAALALTATACNSSPTPNGTAPTPPVKLANPVNVFGQISVAGAKPTVTIKADDDIFGPTFVKVEKGATVSLTLENIGTHAHTFTIDALKVDQMLAPGESKTVAFTLPTEPGANFICKFHRPTGMQGAFYFTDGAIFPGAAQSSGSPSGEPTSEESGYNY